MITVSPIKRRLIYVTLFEATAIILSTLVLMVLSGGGAEDSLPVAVIISTAAVVWNYIYNTAFEAWEIRKQVKVRTLIIRVVHATGFEGGLVLVCLPLYMLWYGVGIWTAMSMEAALLLFFLIYTFIFTLLFDQIFTLYHQNKTINKHL